MNTPQNKGAVNRAAIAFALIGLSVTSSALGDPLQEMIKGGKASLNVRTRFEYVDGQGGASDINGYSIRSRLGLTTGEYEGLKAMVEFEDVSFANPSDRPGLDVPTTEINQLWVAYADDSVSGKLGNQVYTLDDHRFIGHVGWRQNIQTFDALSARLTPSEASYVNLAYLSRVNRINATSQDLDGFLANAGYAFSDELKLVGFAYVLEFDNAAWNPMSTSTVGLRATGEFSADEITFNYAFSFANQTDAGNNAASVDLGYVAGEVSALFSGVKVALGYESLEGNGVRGFTTPLATVHKFNGFADVFAGRSIGLAGGLPQGLEDLYLSASYKLPIARGVPIVAAYHRFDAENAGGDLGMEIDLVANYKLNEYTLLLAKYAYYEADSDNTVGYGGSDASMFSVEANFTF